MQTLSIVLVTVPLAAAVGLALGLWATRNARVERVLNSVFDVMQATPHMAYLGPVVILFGFGQVPAMLADDPFVRSFLASLDEVIAPAISVIDCFDAYLDPLIAPTDMVLYMGAWLLATIDDAWSEDSIRRDVAAEHEGAAGPRE